MIDRRWTLWKVKNGWLAVWDRTSVPDGFDNRAYNMDACTVHNSLRAFADYINATYPKNKKKK